MTDIVERLRKDPAHAKNWSVMMEAADEIERLRAALVKISLMTDSDTGAALIAEAALSKE